VQGLRRSYDVSDDPRLPPALARKSTRQLEEIPLKQPPVDLVVLVNGFPRLSETFVLQEILDLERRGVRMGIVALRRPEETVHQEALAELRAEVTYLPELQAGAPRLAVRTAHAALALRSPGRYLDGIARVVGSPDFSRVNLDRAVLLAHHVLRLGRPPLYVHFAHRPATIGRFASLLSGVPYAVSAHAKDIWLTEERELRAKVRDAQVVLTCTEEGAGRLGEVAGGRTPVRLAHHGVDVEHTPGLATSAGGLPVILAVGRLVPKKGLHTLIEAAGLLKSRGVDFRLRIAGEGPEWATLQRLVHRCDVADRVSFLGPLTPQEVRDELRAASVFALPCRRLPDGDRDGIPNVILEAMSQGLAIAATTLAGVSEAVVHEESGLLSPQDDAGALAQHLERLVRDGRLRARLGRAARRRAVERFDRRVTLAAVPAVLAEAGLIDARFAEAEPPAAAGVRLAA
jgi:glycosyltransferase involved in cell wall biosynthesis